MHLKAIRGAEFRKWATKTLRTYTTDGFVVNPARIEHNKSQFLRAIEDMKLLAAQSEAVGVNKLRIWWRCLILGIWWPDLCSFEGR